MAMNNEKLLHGIDTIIVRVSDIKQSKEWYQNLLGLHPIWEDFEANLVVMDTGSATSLTLWQTNEKIETNKNTSSFPIFKTHDATAAHKALKSKGIAVQDVVSDGSVSYFVFYDPDGNLLEACQVHEG